MEHIKIFQAAFKDLVSGKVTSLLLEDTDDPSAGVPESGETSGEPFKNLSCSYCRVEFTDINHQREHYKLDWHRYNLKQDLLGREVITEEEFVKKSDDVSSISGSESEEETIADLAKAQGKIFLKTVTGKVFSIYRSLIADKKDDINDEILTDHLISIHATKKWTILMLGGGHFAGAVFDGEDPVLHKTFHSYTVRSGQGGSQSARDNKNAGSAPKSAGASLRRYNEQAFAQHVTDILETWQEEIAGSSLIFCRAAGPYNRSVLFGGKSPLVNRVDGRVRIVPFSTRRATFTEVKRIHSLLINVHVYDSMDTVLKQFDMKNSPEKDSKRSKSKTISTNRAKSREIIERPLPVDVSTSSEESTDEPNRNDNLPPKQNDSSDEIKLGFESMEISFRDELEAFEGPLSSEQKKKPVRRKKPKLSKTQKLQAAEDARKKELHDVIKAGDVEKLKNIFKTNVEGGDEERGFVNEVIDAEGSTLMHLAAVYEQTDVLGFLLEEEADVCVKNGKQQTPYTCTKSTVIREFFKSYAVENPDKHNYNKAQIPLPSTDLSAEEIAERKRLQKKAKREKEKVKRKEKENIEKEKREMERFTSLSDREKRALAAERRIISQSGVVISRCFLCGSDMSGKVPFEYLGNRFCTIDCLKGHRMQNPVKLS